MKVCLPGPRLLILHLRTEETIRVAGADELGASGEVIHVNGSTEVHQTEATPPGIFETRALSEKRMSNVNQY